MSQRVNPPLKAARKNMTGSARSYAGSSTSAGTSVQIQQALEKRAEKRAAHSAAKAKRMEDLKNAGNESFKQGDYLSAARLYNTAAQAAGPKPVLMSNLAATYIKMELYDEAEAAATIALEHDPRMIKARFRRGLARKEMGQLEAALVDFETITREDPSCVEAQKEEALVMDRLDSGDYEEDDYYDTDPEWPAFDEGPETFSDSESDSSDCAHTGNGVSCRYYNHGGCSRRETCRFSHAPDEMSIRDGLGKNVCLHFLLDTCKFGAAKCVYSHVKTYLPTGWWDDEAQTARIKNFVQFEGRQENGQSPKIPKALSRMEQQQLREKDGSRGPPGFYKQRGIKGNIAKAKASGSSDTPSEPFIMVLSLEDRGMLEAYCDSLLDALRAKRKLMIATTSIQASDYFASPHLQGVFVTDAGIARWTNAQYLAKLVEFTKSGGSVVIGGSFSSFIKPSDMNTFFERSWGLPWKSGSYHRSIFSLNKSHNLATENSSLVPSFSMKALHVEGIDPAIAVYTPTEGPKHSSESPVVQTLMGKGKLGYIGDVNAEDASTNIVLAMFGILDLPQVSKLAPASAESISKTEPLDGPKPAKVPKVQTKGPRAKSPEGFVMLLSLENEDFFASIHEHLLSALREKVEWKQALSASSALTMLASPDLVGVFVTDPGVLSSKNASVVSKLVEYVKSGGSAVIGGLFSTFANMNNMNNHFSKSWGLKWESGSYHRTTFVLNSSHELAGSGLALPPSYSMKALHVGGITNTHPVYMPTTESRIQSLVFPPTPITDHSESPVVQARIGKGYLGYIGDVNGENESTPVILAMLGLLEPSTTPTPTRDSKQAAPTTNIEPPKKVTPTVNIPGPSKPKPRVEASGSSPEKILPKKKTTPPKPTSRPFIMILSFKGEKFYAEVQAGLLSQLQSKLEVLHGLSNERVIDLLGSSDLVGVLVTDAAIAEPENAYLLSKLVEYTRGGGTTVLGGGTFVSFLTLDTFKDFFQSAWGLPWTMGSYTRSEMTPNEKHSLVTKNSSLPTSFEAVHVAGISSSSAMYVASKQSHIYVPLKQVTQAAMVYTLVGNGNLGYLGDVGLEEPHTKIVLAMFGLLD